MSTPTYPCGHPRTKENTYRNYAGAYCKTCDNERTRRYRQLNPDYNARYLREWRRGLRRLRGCRLERAWRGAHITSSPRHG